MKIYTKAGDDGLTGLLARGRVPKDHLRIEAYGTVDELNAALGVARVEAIDGEADAALSRIQDELFAVGASLADPDPAGRFHDGLKPEHVARLEAEIDSLEARLAPLTQFILPGGSASAAYLHLARTICRRAERVVVALDRIEAEFVAPTVVPYLNRLSDFLFVLARGQNQAAGISDTPWKGL